MPRAKLLSNENPESMSVIQTARSGTHSSHGSGAPELVSINPDVIRKAFGQMLGNREEDRIAQITRLQNIRSDLLIGVLEQYRRTAKPCARDQRHEPPETHYVMHPVPRHVEILGDRGGEPVRQ